MAKSDAVETESAKFYHVIVCVRIAVQLHRVPQKTVQFLWSELRQISTNFDNFWYKDGKPDRIM